MTIASILNIDPTQKAVWEIEGVQFVFTPASQTHHEQLTRQRIINRAPGDSAFMSVGRLQYMHAGAARRLAERLVR